MIAVDWSGAIRGAAQRIWTCEVAAGNVRRLENGRDRDGVGELLVAEAERDPELVVGLDFAFSFPAGFLIKRGRRRATAVWKEAARDGERWLAECPFPFWGKPGHRKPLVGDALYRATELAVERESGRRPKSVFQIAGPGAVGVGSVRGMPLLSSLRQAGFSIWPFDDPQLPLVVEIWPRLFVGDVVKRDADARKRCLAETLPGVRGKARAAAVASDDAFDALVSAMAMDRCRELFPRLERAVDRGVRLEGEIWRPGK